MSALMSGCALSEQPHDNQMVAGVQTCLAQNKQFVDAWGCIQGLDALDKLGGGGIPRGQFMKLGDSLADQVAAKKLSSADAKTRLLAGLPAEGSKDAQVR